MVSVVSAAFTFLSWSVALQAVSLTSATVTETRNQVTLSKEAGEKHAAVIRDVVTGSDVLSTGKKSRAELEFNDQSMVRLGANAIFSFQPNTRNMTVERGSALIHVPPGLPGAKIHSPAVTVAVLGDVVAMRVNEKGVTQIIALSEDARGPVTVTLNKTGETTTLKSGEMMTIDPTDVKIPEISVVSVEVFVQSSGLVNGFGSPLPESAKNEIQRAETTQTQEIKNGNLEGEAGAPEPDAQNLPLTDPTLVQASIGRSVSGHYSGSGVDLPPGGNSFNLVFNINDDGSFSGTSQNTSTLVTNTFTGITSNSGSFTANGSGGNTYQGNISIGAGSASGTYTSSSGNQGTFSVSQ